MWLFKETGRSIDFESRKLFFKHLLQPKAVTGEAQFGLLNAKACRCPNRVGPAFGFWVQRQDRHNSWVVTIIDGHKVHTRLTQNQWENPKVFAYFSLTFPPTNRASAYIFSKSAGLHSEEFQSIILKQF